MRSLGIVGGRDFKNYDLLCRTLDALYFDTVVSGGADGADALAERYAWDHGKKIKIFTADWTKYGRAAGPRRNKEIVEHSDGICAFWDGQSRGTASTIQFCQQAGKPIKIVNY